ncbi:hypothetical protein M407DRAFT_246932 [Tulasnella calospora MUT 4182]|uniref:Uncharacterized protein n=1 Tax=Tulasnella calospora MUT 4182 TaxID=1051891 RepID=A0A0C3K5M7_9AGAM|nr:hypothetical protein M407DRAFT_246932 [Tulasnella calospora MUT 4182]
MYPPQRPAAAHTRNPSDATAPVVSTQPAGGAQMSLHPPKKGESEQTMRLRGGCIPLPGGGTCYIIPCCCPL